HVKGRCRPASPSQQGKGRHAAGIGKCPASLALTRHGHAPNVPRLQQAWACAQRPSHSPDMVLRPASLTSGRHGHVPSCPRTRPAWACA
ncbi:hypothetical protein HAX54_004800, partial [Datura stramonium]|nr:hypothetical protein [Datura stramonium]